VLTPIAHLLNAIPAAVIGGTSLIVYAVVATLGVQMLRRVDLFDHANIFICATALALGLLPIMVPGAYSHFPADARTVLSSGVAVGAFVAVLLNAVFFHLPWRRSATAIPATPTTASPVAASTQRPTQVSHHTTMP
jgi:xanthine/uracil permease